MRNVVPVFITFSAMLALGACDGLIMDPHGEAGADPVAPPGAGLGEGATCGPELRAEAQPLSRLTRVQYDAALRDLLGEDPGLAETFVDDGAIVGFERARSVSALDVEKHIAAAERAADLAVARLDALLPCDPGASVETELACAETFAAAFARRAYRRPLAADELAALVDLYGVGREGETFETGIHLVVQAVLASPDFLYHVERTPEGAPGEVVALDPWALASRLSFFLWNGLPDEALLAAAEGGELDTAEGVRRQAARMVDDPRHEAAVTDFYRQWLDLDRIDGVAKDTEVYPAFDFQVARSLRASLEALVLDVHFGEGGGRVEELFLGTHAFVDEHTAPLFGVEGTFGATAERVPLDPAQRRGLLTHPGLLALLAKPDQSDPIHRGLFVRDKLLCQSLPDPPPDVDTTVPPPTPGLSTRERFAAHTADPACASCHRLIDPIGFGFEQYDGIGRFRTTDEGVPVDASGALVEAGDAAGEFEGLVQLAERLGRSETVRACYARQWYRYALRRAETRDDACVVEDIAAAFEASGGDLGELLVAIAASDAFRHRRITAVTEEER